MHKFLFSTGSIFLLCTNLFSSVISQDPSNSSLIIYNSNLALVHEERDISLTKEDTNIIYQDVAQSINIDSISAEFNPPISIQTQQYRYDKLTQAKLLKAHVGKQVSVRRLKSAYEYQVIPATLLAYNGLKSIVKTIDFQILTIDSSSIIVENIPKELISKPSLLWNLQKAQDIKTKLKLNYLINNISFKNDYILNLDNNSSSLSGWITIDNHSGKDFKNIKLSVVAGDINRVTKTQRQNKMLHTLSYESKAQEVTYNEHEGYYFYTIPFKVSLANNEKLQINFMKQEELQATKEYEAVLDNPLYLHGEKSHDVMQYLSLKALEAPLPKGIIRTYSQYKNETILLGETEIKHTSKGIPLRLRLGKEFDQSVKQTVLKREDRENWLSSDIEYILSNNSNKTKTIKLLIPFNNKDDSIIQTTKNYTITKGNFVTFSLLVAANASEKFKVHFESKK